MLPLTEVEVADSRETGCETGRARGPVPVAIIALSNDCHSLALAADLTLPRDENHLHRCLR